MAGVISSAILRTQTDERLVALSRTGHKRAFEAIAERYRGELTRALRRSLPSASVEDVLQQIHLQAWQALAAGTEVRELRAWLHRIARNAAIAAASRGYDYDELKDALLVTPGPEEDLERRDAVRRALRGIAELPERQRDALLAVAVDGRSHAEVGFDLGITDTAARQLVRRARVSLIGLMSVATPPQVIEWAARAGHSVVVGKAAAGKAAAGKAAAGTGIGGSLGGSALKVGVIAVTVGGVAAGVPPIRHALVPPSAAPSSAMHRHAQARAAGPAVAVAATVAAKSPRQAGAATHTVTGHSSADARRRAARDAGPLLVSSVDPAPVAVVVAPAAATPSQASPAGEGSPAGQAGAAATSSAQAIAALWAWWLAHHTHGSSGSSPTSRVSAATGESSGQLPSGGASQPTGQSQSAGGSQGCPPTSTSTAGSASSTSTADQSRSVSTATSGQGVSPPAGGGASSTGGASPAAGGQGGGSSPDGPGTRTISPGEPTWPGSGVGSTPACAGTAGQTGSGSQVAGP